MQPDKSFIFDKGFSEGYKTAVEDIVDSLSSNGLVVEEIIKLTGKNPIVLRYLQSSFPINIVMRKIDNSDE